MKTILKNTARLLVLVIIAMTSINAKTGTDLFLQASDPDVEIENWMVDESAWMSTENYTQMFIPEQEEDINVALWMTCDVAWGDYEFDFSQDDEGDLNVDDWMKDDRFW